MLCFERWKGNLRISVFITYWLFYRQVSLSTALVTQQQYSATKTSFASSSSSSSIIISHRSQPVSVSLRAENKPKDEKDLTGLLNELNQNFNYEGRMESTKSIGKDFRCGFVVIIGAPNMGKSTLMNALLQEDLCIATARPQTTRHAILGLLSTDSSQVCLVDTPGVIEQPAYKLQQGMMEAVLGAFYDADVLMVVTDVYSTPIPNDTLFQRVQQSQLPVIVVINKVDLLDQPSSGANAKAKDKMDGNGKDDDGIDDDNDDYGVPVFEKTTTIEEAVARWRSLLPKAIAIIPVAASRGGDQVGVQTVRHLLTASPEVDASFRNMGRPIPGMFRDTDKLFLSQEEVSSLLPISPPLYDTELLTDRPERFIASEMIRAALFQTLRKEVPYCCEVRLQSFKEQPDESIRMEATIVVERDSQKAIVIGKGGSAVKDIRIQAQKSLEDFFQTGVALFLTVVVDKDWRKNEKRLQEYGYMQPKKKKKPTKK